MEEHVLGTPIGAVRYRVDRGKLVGLDFAGSTSQRTPRDPIGRAVAAYFAGECLALRRVPLRLEGTEFCMRVWRELRRLAPGKTISYAEVAARIGQPRAVRAVARANAANRIALVVPCHRVIGSDGSLVGYSFGLERKAWLLRHEGAPRGA